MEENKTYDFDGSDGDIIIASNDKHIYRCHMLVLMEYSEYFSTMLRFDNVSKNNIITNSNGLKIANFDYPSTIIRFTFQMIYNVYHHHFVIYTSDYTMEINDYIKVFMLLDMLQCKTNVMDDVVRKMKLTSSVKNNWFEIVRNYYQCPQLAYMVNALLTFYTEIDERGRYLLDGIDDAVIDAITDDKQKIMMLSAGKKRIENYAKFLHDEKETVEKRNEQLFSVNYQQYKLIEHNNQIISKLKQQYPHIKRFDVKQLVSDLKISKNDLFQNY